MLDLRVLERFGATTERVRELCSSPNPPPEFVKLNKRIFYHAKYGLEFNLRNGHIYQAINAAWDAPFFQTSATMLLNLRGQKLDQALADKIAEALNIQKYITTEYDEKTQKYVKVFDYPKFIETVIPFVRLYVTMRLSKLFNDRRNKPLLQYVPAVPTKAKKYKTDILTRRMDIMAEQYDYENKLKQAILGMLLYNVQIQFIEREWDRQYDYIIDENGGLKKRIDKEGLSYVFPEVYRTYWDLAYPPSTLLTDIGCKWVGYWKMVRFKEIRDNPAFWNVDRVSISPGMLSLFNNAQYFFNVLYPCKLEYPSQIEAPSQLLVTGELGTPYLTPYLEDKACPLFEHFEKIVPAEYGIGSYKEPVWFRFVMAGEGTIIYAAPLPACPAIPYCDISHDARTMSPSFALEIVPFQDLATNTISQAILTAKQNLKSMIFIDKSLLNEDIVQYLQSAGDSFYEKTQVVPVDSRRLAAAQINLQQAVHAVSFPHLDVYTLMQTLNTIIGIMERCVQVSAQEVGSYASHQQSAEEIRVIATSTTNRLELTGHGVDAAMNAWAKQLYNYAMNYNSEDIYLDMEFEGEIDESVLAKLGITIEDKTANNNKTFARLKLKKSAMEIETFAVARSGMDRPNNEGIAAAMAQIYQQIVVALGPVLGAEQLVELTNQILDQLGLPRDFRLRIPEQARQQLQGAPPDAQKQVIAQVLQNLKPLIEKVQELDVNNQKTQQVLNKVVLALESFAQRQPQQGQQGQQQELVPQLQGLETNQQPQISAV